MSISTRSAVATSIIGRYLSLSLQFISTMILARLLTPKDIGIYSVGFSIVALAHLFRDFGLNQYVIQEKTLDPTKISTTFTISLILSWFLGALVYSLSGAAAIFFNEIGVENLIRLLSLNFFIIPFGSITLALLRKNLQFHITASIGFFAVLAGVVTAIWSAYNGTGYICLAYGAIVETSATVLFSFFFRPTGLKFSLALTGGKEILKFGSLVGIGNIINQFSTSATDAIVARMLGLNILGFFSRAFGTFSLFDHIFVSSIRPTILPLFSRDSRDTSKLTAAYTKALSYSFALAWPFFGIMFLYTEELVHVLYGFQWDAAIPGIKFLCLAGIFLPPILFIDNLFVALGRPDITLKVQAFSNAAKLVFVVIACFYNLEAVCIALVFYFLTKLLAAMYFARRLLPLGWLDIMKLGRQALPCALSTLVFAFCFSFLAQVYVEDIFLNLAITLVAAAAGWIVGLNINGHPLREEVNLLFDRIASILSIR